MVRATGYMLIVELRTDFCGVPPTPLMCIHECSLTMPSMRFTIHPNAPPSAPNPDASSGILMFAMRIVVVQ